MLGNLLFVQNHPNRYANFRVLCINLHRVWGLGLQGFRVYGACLGVQVQKVFCGGLDRVFDHFLTRF